MTVVVPSGASAAYLAGTNGHVFFKKHVSPRSVECSFTNFDGKAQCPVFTFATQCKPCSFNANAVFILPKYKSAMTVLMVP